MTEDLGVLGFQVYNGKSLLWDCEELKRILLLFRNCRKRDMNSNSAFIWWQERFGCLCLPCWYILGGAE